MNARTTQKCPCGRKRPAARKPSHLKVLERPYEEWVAEFGEVCGICGALPVSRRLDRDHCHKRGIARGLLCVRCNRALPSWVTAAWLRRAAEYVARAEEAA